MKKQTFSALLNIAVSIGSCTKMDMNNSSSLRNNSTPAFQSLTLLAAAALPVNPYYHSYTIFSAVR